MHDVMSPDLVGRFEAHAGNAGHREPAIVTADEPMDRATLEGAGMEVTFVSSDGRIASGSVTREALEQVSTLEHVVRIEADTEMHALGD